MRTCSYVNPALRRYKEIAQNHLATSHKTCGIVSGPVPATTCGSYLADVVWMWYRGCVDYKRARVPGSRRQKVEFRAKLAEVQGVAVAQASEITFLSLRPLALLRIKEALERGYGAGIRDSDVLSAAWQLITRTDGRPPMVLPAGEDGVDLYALIHAVLRAPASQPAIPPGAIVDVAATVLPDEPAPDSSIT